MLPLQKMKETINAFVQLGNDFRNTENESLKQRMQQAAFNNPWFDMRSINLALNAWGEALQKESVNEWALMENMTHFPSEPKKVGLVLAGNIPLVGLHDLLCVLAAGHHAHVKLSSDDSILMQYAIERLIHHEPSIQNRIQLVERLKEIDAIIATGSNNSSRYFEHYFAHIPHIIRKNRNSLAILTGTESAEELFLLGSDVFDYYGLGCRNVTHLLMPAGYSPATFYDAIADHYEVLNHNKYANNYTYHRALFLLNKQAHLDNNFLLLKEDEKLYSPIGCLNYSFYEYPEQAEEYVHQNAGSIQVIVSKGNFTFPTVALGQAQKPKLWDYADNINPFQFLQTI